MTENFFLCYLRNLRMSFSWEGGQPKMPIRIMVVDAQTSFLKMIENSVASLDWCELETVQTSEEAVNKLEKERFDGLLVKARMPDLDGFEITRRVRGSTLNSGVPVVMLGDEDDINMVRQGFRAGVTFFMTRPTNPELVHRLLAAVRGVMTVQKRRFLRLPYRTPVTCRWSNGEPRHFLSESIEIGEGGISIKPSGGLEIGQHVELEFTPPEAARPAKPDPRKQQRLVRPGGKVVARPQKIQAVVCHKNAQDTVGLGFTNLSPALREVIQHYLTGASEI